jgi:hypothetical protein
MNGPCHGSTAAIFGHPKVKTRATQTDRRCMTVSSYLVGLALMSLAVVAALFGLRRG